MSKVNKRNWVPLLLGLLFLIVLPAGADTVIVEAGRDATLIEDPDGEWANGSGPVFFAGRTSQTWNGIRRGLLFFDVAGALPRNAIIENVSLRLFELGGNSGTSEVRLHRVLAPWGEGPSAASGGGGAPRDVGDATWLHAEFEDQFWVHSGGQFVGRASAGREVDRNAAWTWESTPHLVQDVRLWISAPQRNFGWIVIGDETTRQTAKKFASRENTNPAVHPVLEISYRLRGEAPARRR